ncbi:hypothetical protein CDAR_58141 [Caerostris darwini]|uniref:Uncharacterized protein n=1 Tax=Caerostris darwini TaxID=1538125 RepID=A0AAV4U731_9ARAC|nr:hypothetical protein CDAR_58141 [Caerostris darwini]
MDWVLVNCIEILSSILRYFNKPQRVLNSSHSKQMDDVKFPGEQSWATHLQVRALSLMDGRPSVHMESKEKGFPRILFHFFPPISSAPQPVWKSKS